MLNFVKESYEDGVCPECGIEIPDNVSSGDECADCGHVFYAVRPSDDYYCNPGEDEDYDPNDWDEDFGSHDSLFDTFAED